MVELTKKNKKQLRELMIKAYAKELDELLVALSKKFDAWKNHQIDCWELEELIHKFHNGHAKKLFNSYNSKVDPILISRVLAKNSSEKRKSLMRLFHTWKGASIFSKKTIMMNFHTEA